jgi:hypothetical protein
MAGSDHCIMDHCSISWGIDEEMSTRSSKNVTLQRVLISEALNVAGHSNYPAGTAHGYAASIGGDIGSFHHNLLAHNEGRNWSMGGGLDGNGYYSGKLDIRNNVVYNWRGRTTDGGAHEVNFLNNYYKPGPATSAKKIWFINPSAPYGQFFLSGNYLFGKGEVNQNNVKGVKADHPDSAVISAAFDVELVSEQPAEKAYSLVLKNAGASLCRDAVDLRIIEEVKSGKSSSGKNKNGIIDSQKEVGGWPVLKSLAPKKDSDADGIPDQWEIQNKLNPNEPGDAAMQTINTSYSNIEIYLNSLVDKVTTGK